MLYLPSISYITKSLIAKSEYGCVFLAMKVSLKTTFWIGSATNIRGLCSNFIESESFLESNSPDILVLVLLTFTSCEPNLNDLIDSGNFSITGYLPLIRKTSITHMFGLAVYVKALLHSVSYFFFLYRSPSSSLCTVFDSISSNIDEVLSINPSAYVFAFGDFNMHHRDCLSYSGGTDRPDELCYEFFIITNDLL